MKIKLFIAASVLFTTAYLAYSYIYQGHRDILSEKATISLTSEGAAGGVCPLIVS